MVLVCPYSALFLAYAATYSVPAALPAAIAHWESGFNPNAIGDAGHSIGLMQLHDQGAGYGWTIAQRRDPATNIDVGTAYVRRCLDAFGGDLRFAISAYNQGIGGARDRGWEFNRHYVDGILSLYRMYSGAELELPVEPGPPPVIASGCATTAAGAVAVVIAIGGIAYAVCRALL